MRRMIVMCAVGVFAVFGGLAACDKGGSGGIDDCEALLDQMKELEKEGTGSFEEKEDEMVELCEEGDLLEKHSETIGCLEKADSSKEAEQCDGVQKMIMSWGMAGMEDG